MRLKLTAALFRLPLPPLQLLLPMDTTIHTHNSVLLSDVAKSISLLKNSSKKHNNHNSNNHNSKDHVRNRATYMQI
jgi:hypothetical protein